jgi:hypothetical protein
MLDPPSPVRAQEVKPETILGLIDCVHQLLPQRNPLGRIDDAFEYGELDPLAMIGADLGHFAQAPRSGLIPGCHIVTHQDHHRVTSR